MKSKFVTGLLIAASLVGGMGSLSSCKDTCEDNRVITSDVINQLKQDLEAARKAAEKAKEEAENAKTDANNAKTAAEQAKAAAESAGQDATEAVKEALNDYATKEQLAKGLEELKTNIDALLGQIPESAEAETFADWIAGVQTVAAEAKALGLENKEEIRKIKEVLGAYTNADITNAVEQAAWVKQNRAVLENVVETYADVVSQVETLGQGYQEITQALQLLIDTLAEWRDAMDQKLESIDTSIFNLTQGLDGLSLRVDTLAQQVADNAEAIRLLQEKTDSILGAMNKQVTSLLVQGTHNPVFGSFSAPLGITSNILLLQYGYTTHAVDFPNTNSEVEFDNSLPFSEQDIQILANAGINLEQPALTLASNSTVYNDAAGNAGEVYVTVNPSNVDFSGKTLTLVNSQDEASGVKLTPLKKSDKVLSFGFGRAADNGFYEAGATLAASEIDNVKVDIDASLKEAFKNAYHNRTAADFAYLLKQLYNQFNGILPAQGLKASYEGLDAQGQPATFNVYSEYCIAASAYKPLSYGFLAGKHFKHLPEFPGIDMDKFKFDPDAFEFPINFPTITVDGVELSFELKPVTIDYNGTISVTINMPQFTKDGQFLGYKEETFDVPADQIQNLIGEIQNAFNENIGTWNTEIKSAFDDAIGNLVANIQGQINSAMDDVAGQIKDNISNMIGEINDQLADKIGGYINRFNRYIDKYNSLRNRINKYLDEPNHFMQPMMCYEGGNGGFGQVARNQGIPTRFYLNGGNAISLILTSYNAEIAVPAYKKYVVVTNVYKTGDQSVNASNDSTCLDLLKAANKPANFFATPLDGQQLRVALQVSKPGYTYEVAFQGLDYQGYTSTDKYYIEVAE